MLEIQRIIRLCMNRSDGLNHFLDSIIIPIEMKQGARECVGYSLEPSV